MRLKRVRSEWFPRYGQEIQAKKNFKNILSKDDRVFPTLSGFCLSRNPLLLPSFLRPLLLKTYRLQEIAEKVLNLRFLHLVQKRKFIFQNFSQVLSFFSFRKIPHAFFHIHTHTSATFLCCCCCCCCCYCCCFFLSPSIIAEWRNCFHCWDMFTVIFQCCLDSLKYLKILNFSSAEFYSGP